jgi:SnoaL-like domain
MTNRMNELVRALAEAKSRQDVAAAIALQHEDMLLDVPPLMARVQGKCANEQALTGFFKAFPDYSATLEGSASGDGNLVCWGRVRMTLSTDRFGVQPGGSAADIPASLRFTFKDGLIASEYFLWDLAEACAQ